jgi:hypothetical protein
VSGLLAELQVPEEQYALLLQAGIDGRARLAAAQKAEVVAAGLSIGNRNRVLKWIMAQGPAVPDPAPAPQPEGVVGLSQPPLPSRTISAENTALRTAMDEWGVEVAQSAALGSSPETKSEVVAQLVAMLGLEGSVVTAALERAEWAMEAAANELQLASLRVSAAERTQHAMQADALSSARMHADARLLAAHRSNSSELELTEGASPLPAEPAPEPSHAAPPALSRLPSPPVRLQLVEQVAAIFTRDGALTKFAVSGKLWAKRLEIGAAATAPLRLVRA